VIIYFTLEVEFYACDSRDLLSVMQCTIYRMAALVHVLDFIYKRKE